MIQTSEKKSSGSKKFKVEVLRYLPPEIKTKNTAKTKKFIEIPRQDSGIWLIVSYLELNLIGFHAAAQKIRYLNEKDIELAKLGSIASFSVHKLTTTN